MKKILLVLAVTYAAPCVFAQDSEGLTSKKGEAILPEANDWALMIDAVPVMDYLGNMLNGNTANTSPTWGYPGTPLAITGKMFKDEKTAYRGMLRLGFGSSTERAFSMQDGQSDPAVTVEDSWKSSYNQIVLGGGLEMRRGKTRLQGFYGGMLMIGLGGSKDEYSYGNAFSSSNTNPTRTDFGNNNPAPGVWVTSEKAGSTFMIGLRGFVGAEYFIFPKMAVGAEFGWGLGMANTGDGESTVEYWDAQNNAPKSITSKSGGNSMFGLDTDINGFQMMPTGALTLSLHF